MSSVQFADITQEGAPRYRIQYDDDPVPDEEQFKGRVVDTLKGKVESPSGFTVSVYIVTITMIMLFVFVPLLVVVFALITDILNQLLSTVSMAFVAFKRLQVGKSQQDYKFGQLLCQASWIIYSMPVVTFFVSFAVKLIAFFFQVIKEQLLDFEYHEKYINKIKKWIIPKIRQQRDAKADLLNEVRPEPAKILETYYYVLKDDNNDKKHQAIALGIFGAIVISYIVCIVLSLFSMISIEIVLLCYTFAYLFFPLIGILDCLLRAWRNVLAIVHYKHVNSEILKDIRRKEIIHTKEVEKFEVQMKLFRLGIAEDPDEKAFAKKQERYEAEMQKTKACIKKVNFINLTYWTTSLLKKLYSLKIFEMVYPKHLLGHDDFGQAIQENTPFIGDFPFLTFFAFLAGMGIRIFLFARDWGQTNNADSYFPSSIAITILYIFAGPYIMIMSHFCGTYSLLKWSNKQKAEKERKVNMYREMFEIKINFNMKGEPPKDDALLTAYQQYKKEQTEKQDAFGFIYNADDDEEEEDKDDENPDLPVQDNANDQNGKPQDFAKSIAKTLNIDEILEGQGSLKSAAIIVQILYVIVMVIVIFCGICVLTWNPPNERIALHKMFVPSLIKEGYFDPPQINNSICTVSVNDLTITELSALPLLAYFANGEINLETRIHNINVVLDLAFRRTRTRGMSFNMTEMYCVDWDDCMFNKNASDVTTVLKVYNNGVLDYNVLIPFGMRDKGDWIIVLEMYMQQYPNAFLGEMVPLYDFFMDIFGDVIYSISTQMQKLCGVRSITIKHALRVLSIAEQLPGDHNIAVGQTIGGYFAKYIGYMLRKSFSAVGFDSLSFKENALCGDYQGDQDDPFSIINVYAGSGWLESEESIPFNYMHTDYDFGFQTKFRPPNATDAFCHSVAECSTDQIHIDFCDRMLGHERFTNTMNAFKREWHTY